MKYLLIAIMLIGCKPNSEIVEVVNKTEITLTDTGNKSTYWELKHYYNAIPKYSGAFGTYTAKHTPIAIKHNNKIFYTFSDNSDGILKIYVSDESVTTEVHQSPLYNDPHSNASISIDSDNHILIYVSAKGHKEIGAIYRSVLPNDIGGFDLVEQTWMAYPQPWRTSEGQTILHTIYEDENSKKTRHLYVKNTNCHKKLMNGGHYQISTYDGSRLHTAYNYHPNGDVDARTNLYYMYSDNGCDWFNKDGFALSFPLEADSQLTKILDTDKLIYLKDIGMKGNIPKILYIESTTPNPLEGTFNSRKYYLTSPHGTPLKISNSGHNYNTGYYYYKNNIENIIIPTFSPDPSRASYAGGYLTHKIIRSDNSISTIKIFTGFYNYARKVHNGNGIGIVSEDIDHKNSGKIIKIQ